MLWCAVPLLFQDITGGCANDNTMFWVMNQRLGAGGSGSSSDVDWNPMVANWSQLFAPPVIITSDAKYAWNADVADFDGDGYRVWITDRLGSSS